MLYEINLTTQEKPVTIEGEKYQIDQSGNLIIVVSSWQADKNVLFAAGKWIYIKAIDKVENEQ